MKEFLRVVDRKFVALFFVLFVVNIGLFLNDIYKGVMYDTSVIEKSEYIEMRSQAFEENLKEIPNITFEETTDIKEQIRKEVIYSLNMQKEYFLKYENKYNSMLEYAETSANISIFNENNSFSKRNIEKTLEDFKSVKDVKLEYGNNDWILSVTNYKLTDIFVFALIMFFVLKFILEESNGLLYFVQSTKGGRGILTGKRVSFILLTAPLMTFVFNAGVVITSLFAYNQKFDFTRSIQSIEEFENCPLCVNIGQFILLSIFMKCIVILAISFIAYAILMKVGDKKNGIIILAVFLAIEYLLYTFVDSQSFVAAFKYFNVFNYIDMYRVIGVYRNINIFSIPANIFYASIYISIILILTFVAYVMYKGTIIYKDKTKIFKNIRLAYDRFRKKISKTIDRQGVLLGEAGKLFIILDGILIVLVAGYLASGRIDNEKLTRTQEGKIKAIYFEEFEGVYDEHIYEKIDAKSKELSDENEKLLNDMEEATQEENMINSVKLAAIQVKMNALQEVKNQADYLRELYEKEGIRGYITEDIGVKYLFGEPLKTDYTLNRIIIGFFIAFFAGSAFAYENKSNMYAFVNSTKNGMKSLWFGKAFWCVVMSVLYTAVISFIEYSNVCGKVGISGLNGAIQSFELFRDFPFEVTLGNFVVIYYVAKCVLSAVLSVLALFISKHFNKTSSAQLVTIIVIIGVEVIL